MNKPALGSFQVVEAAPLIDITDLRKTYNTGDVAVEVLHGISLTIFPGEFLAIMGSSGSGKSTLMNIIGCLDRPTSGSYNFNGEDVSGFDPDELARLRREAFGFIFQSYNLISTSTATENVEVPAVYAGLSAEQRHTRAEELLTRLGLAERLHHRPNQLSGGQQQRVSIARALMNGGQIILADEPTGALDSKSGAEVMELLTELSAQGHTVILITHDREVAQHARRIIEIKDGMILSDSGPDTNAEIEKAQARLQAVERAEGASWSDAGEAVGMAFRALRANFFRTVLTLLGIVIGVGSVVAMLAIGEGAKQSVVAQIGSMGTNLLLVRPSAPQQRGVGGTAATMVPADAEAMSQVPNVIAAVPELTGSVTARFGSIDYQTQANATWTDLPAVRSWPVSQGTFFTEEDQRSYASVAVLGVTAYQQLFPDGDNPIGQYILLKNVPFQVIGIMSPKGATAGGNDADDVIFVPLSTGSLRLFGQRFLRSITVAVKDVALIDVTQDALTELLTARHNGNEDFFIRNMAAVVETASEAQNTLTILLGSVAAISLLVRRHVHRRIGRPAAQQGMKLSPGELLLTTREGSEADLVSELSGARVLGPALVAAPADATAAPSRLVFARQGFPVHAVVAAEPKAVAVALTEAVKAAVAGAATAWTLQAWVADAEVANQLAGDMRRLASAALDAAETSSPRFRMRHVETAEQAHTMDGALAQLCMLSKNEVAVGATRTRDALSLIPGGRARQKAEAAAPSRAAMKLEEAFEWLGRGPDPGDLCVDLGAAPGGWCHVVLKRRARVIAVDPAQLSPTIKGKKGLSHVCASAFDFEPNEPVDWLLCDMAWRPLEVAQLLAKWAKRNWARQLVANIKLPMTQKIAILTRVRETLTEGGWQDVRARQLYHDRDEITLSAWRTA